MSPSVDAQRQGVHEAEDSPAVVRARVILNAAGVRFLDLEGVRVVGVWSDRDGVEVRAALLATGAAGVPVKYLDAPDVPDRFKSRGVPGEAVPLGVLSAMERSPEPWKVRDALLAEMGWKVARRG